MSETAIEQYADEPEQRDPQWYKRAVFYEVLVRAFSDSNGDGTGDLKGLTERLDYLQWLGVDCLWLPPFFSSPCATAGTTSATSPTCSRSSARSATSWSSSTPRTSAACA